MEINISFDKEFDEIWETLQRKYPKKLFDLDGVGKQLDFSEFTRNFFGSKGVTADKSVDANSNVEDSSVVAYHSEVMKPLKRLNSYYMLWKGMRKYFSTKLADEVLEMQLCGDIYINDYHDFFIKSYCFNYSTYDVMANGLPYMKKINCIPPKYLLTFKQQLEQFTVFASNNQSGAAGQADLLIIMSHYVKKALDTKSDCHIDLGTEENVWQYVKEILTSYIYTINQPFKTAESPFTNVSVYDRL